MIAVPKHDEEKYARLKNAVDKMLNRLCMNYIKGCLTDNQYSIVIIIISKMFSLNPINCIEIKFLGGYHAYLPECHGETESWETLQKPDDHIDILMHYDCIRVKQFKSQRRIGKTCLNQYVGQDDGVR